MRQAVGGQDPAAGSGTATSTLVLRHTDKPLVEIADSVGYQSGAAFTKAFKRSSGAAPGAA